MTKVKAGFLSFAVGVIVAGITAVVALFLVAGFTWSAIHSGVSNGIYWMVVFAAYAVPPLLGLLAGRAAYWITYDRPDAPESGATQLRKSVRQM